MSGREIARDTHLAGETGTSLAETVPGMNPGHQRQRGKSDDGVLREAHNHWRDRTDTQPGRHARDRLQLLRRRCPHHSDQHTNLGTVPGAIGVPSTVRGCHSRPTRNSSPAGGSSRTSCARWDHGDPADLFERLPRPALRRDVLDPWVLLSRRQATCPARRRAPPAPRPAARSMPLLGGNSPLPPPIGHRQAPAAARHPRLRQRPGLRPAAWQGRAPPRRWPLVYAKLDRIEDGLNRIDRSLDWIERRAPGSRQAWPAP